MVCKYGMRCFKVSRGDHCDSRDRAGGLPLERFIQVSTLAGQLKFAPIGGSCWNKHPCSSPMGPLGLAGALSCPDELKGGGHGSQKRLPLIFQLML